MKLLFLLLVSGLSFNAVAKEKHSHGAHVHGVAKLAVAFDELKGKVEFKGAAEGVLGFEYAPKTEKDKKAVADVTKYFEEEISQMVQLDASLGCQFTKEQIGQVPEAGEKTITKHSEWVANYTVVCKKSPLGTKITFDFTQITHLNDLDITVLVGNLQKSEEFKKKPVTIELK